MGLLCATTGRAWHRLPPGAEGWKEAGYGAMRGVTVGPIESSQHPGRGYGTAASAELLDELARMGVNWIAVTPYGRLWDGRSTEILMDFEAPYERNRRDMATMVRQARERGIRVLMVPHLWMEAGGYRLHIDPGSRARWERFLESYRRFVVAWAADAAEMGVDAYAIGQECQSFSGQHGAYWRQLIRDVREVFPGLVTYSANWWEEVEDVIFWDQLDLIGVNAFYELGWDKNTPEEHHVKAQEALADLERVVDVLDMPVIFTEIGYMSVENATLRPHTWPEDAEQPAPDEKEQTRGFETMFQYFLPQPWFAGLFVWRYYASLDDVSQEPEWGFSPHTKEAEAYLSSAFRAWWGADPEPGPWPVPTSSPVSQPFDVSAGLFPWTDRP